MIECESVSKAAHQLSSTSTMERGYSLEAVIDAGTSNHDQEKQSNLFTLPGNFVMTVLQWDFNFEIRLKP